jgi:hypothetical protein
MPTFETPPNSESSPKPESPDTAHLLFGYVNPENRNSTGAVEGTPASGFRTYDPRNYREVPLRLNSAAVFPPQASGPDALTNGVLEFHSIVPSETSAPEVISGNFDTDNYRLVPLRDLTNEIRSAQAKTIVWSPGAASKPDLGNSLLNRARRDDVDRGGERDPRTGETIIPPTGRAIMRANLSATPLAPTEQTIRLVPKDVAELHKGFGKLGARHSELPSGLVSLEQFCDRLPPSDREKATEVLRILAELPEERRAPKVERITNALIIEKDFNVESLVRMAHE